MATDAHGHVFSPAAAFPYAAGRAYTPADAPKQRLAALPGAIALYAEHGWEITVACLSFGERGESAKLWRDTGMTIEKVKAARQDEAVGAADVLGARTVLFDAGDYPMRIFDETLY